MKPCYYMLAVNILLVKMQLQQISDQVSMKLTWSLNAQMGTDTKFHGRDSQQDRNMCISFVKYQQQIQLGKNFTAILKFEF